MERIRVHFAIEGSFQDSVDAGRHTWDSTVLHKHGILPVNLPQPQAPGKSGVVQWCHLN
jgi:hypothetical protein